MAKKNAKAKEAAAATSGSDVDKKPAASKPVAKEASKKSSSSVLFLVLPVLVALVGGLYTTFVVPPTDSALATTTQSAVVNTSVTVDPLKKYPQLTNKYASQMIQIETQQLLTPHTAACPAFEIVGDLMHVEDAMDKTAEQLRQEQLVFLMLNGQNEGLYVKWQAKDACLRELALFAGEKLGADVDVLANGVKLFTQMGLPITSVEQFDQEAGRIAHVLLDFQIWVWPGIKVGHVFEVEGTTVKTLSMRPKVFGVEGFFNEEEAQEIMRQGIDRLERSPVDSAEAVDGYHSDRTSFTAFLHDNEFTRDFRARTAKLTRLPSPSFVERLQLVRYEKGQFFRKHEDYFDSKQFLPKKEIANEDYKLWCTWAVAKIQELVTAGADVPADFLEGGKMYPNYEDKVAFQHAILEAFMEDAKEVDFFREHADVEWGEWISSNLENGARDIVDPLLRDKGYLLPHIIKSWEKRAGFKELKFTIPKRPVSGVTHYFRWIRWVKEHIQNLLDQDASLVPAEFKPEGDMYPTYHISYQNRILKYVLEDHTEEELAAKFGEEWAKWLIANKDSSDVLWQALKTSSEIFDLVVESFTKRAGEHFAYSKPTHLQHFEPNRFVTVFLYLNECLEGGETVFPYSKERLVTNIEREGMAECSEGLAVPPVKLTAAMFYAQSPENFPDPASLHGGCPPARGIKYGSNSFAWNADADEGANAWGLGSDLKADPSAL
ncbi:hypothetical protein Poli38472_006607 [Pythium oligandrum]|uniref:Prolyl 4-hydroxylase alpha subunit domain-containing protein n=1 Tax=Pythium oligandrum TaxID=41045 RepID=A0A8K1FEG1_PYTOL|nr:hypothetical protein Poli38472_006607 [Pythium oligandrum]|eukprot:TMW56597.1 hypothetical protein Poli38472_006607 [Pythium oligandrum]